MGISVKLESLKGVLKDAARPNRFSVSIATSNTGNQGAAWSEDKSFLVKTFSLPAREIGEILVNFQGMQTKMAGDPTFAAVTMTLHNDYDWNAKNFFEQWMEGIALVETEGTNTRTAPAEYKTEITVEQLGRDGETLATYVLVGAYPTSMDAIELSHESNDTLEELSITLSIDYWYQEK
jgi:hypothetical protein